jgi:hypothetical protein
MADVERAVRITDKERPSDSGSSERPRNLLVHYAQPPFHAMPIDNVRLISGNSAKTSHLLEKVSHMDPKTYNRLLDLQKELQKSEVAQWYQTELLFTPGDFKTVKDNVDQAVDILTPRKGRDLFLDASLSVALGAEEEK